ncbi:MAG TPA: hypothetical protein VG675_06215 [Bryobacteraceae bacterium]|nr:hypothetical protein [Bryobacteraceae bacterium]
MIRCRNAAYWIVPMLACLALYWHGFTAWFRGDDFAWLSLGLRVHNFQDLLNALFTPRAQGTIRPLSERAFFLAGYGLFGLNPLPFRLVVFATQFANLALVAAIGSRLSGMRTAGFCAAIFWLINSALAQPLGWVCVYNEVLCALFLLLALYFLLRYIETGSGRYNVYQWIAFLLGFGALEVTVVYPLIAAGYTFLCAPKYFRRTLPLFIPSVIYVLVHNTVAPLPSTGTYGMHFDGSVFHTLLTYWTWTLSSTFLQNPMEPQPWVLPAGVALISIGLLLFLARQWQGSRKAAAFCVLWFLATVAPVLPLRDHLTEYYIYLPSIGLAWLGGWAFAAAWRAGRAAKACAVLLAAMYILMTAPEAVAASEWNYTLTMRTRDLVGGLVRAHQLHPNRTIVLYGVDSDLFWSGVRDHPFWLLGMQHVYLAPGSESRINNQNRDEDLPEFVLPPGVTANALARDQLVIYAVAGRQLRNITSVYRVANSMDQLPSRVDAGSPLTAYLLGPEWYGVDGNHRWMPKRATLRLAAPAAPGEKLYLDGNCPEETVKNGLSVSVTVNGIAEPPARISPNDTSFDLAFPLPDSVVGKSELSITVEVNRTLRPPGDERELGLAFGTFAVR